jgi:hypothetical protein
MKPWLWKGMPKTRRCPRLIASALGNGARMAGGRRRNVNRRFVCTPRNFRWGAHGAAVQAKSDR